MSLSHDSIIVYNIISSNENGTQSTNLFFHGIICLGFLHPTPSSSTTLPASHPPRVHLVDSHILPDDSFKASVSKDFEWQRLDDSVRTWIYGTISPSLLQSIVRPDDCAFDAWTRIENNFQNNKTSQILHLESQFNDISLSNFSNVKAYCNELETITTSLTNLGASISDNRLALQVLYGLNSDYKNFRSLVQHMTPIPSFDTLRSMLELEERSNHKHSSTAQDTALITTSKANSNHFASRGTSHHHGGHR
ncbi:uncharacterized protein LOC130798808 [Amaranthus tricolor]|uniref:uncharacterized protein LOC130798808 n=1 Tax=Amaranthus tricolor TaxID=29722 RepID=UPI00258F7CAE|nr:uncharacterized protein LOC130798808 [Amaranthus tricolor]